MHTHRKKVYILYPDGIIAYSPTVLNLYDSLSSLFDVTIFSYEPDKYFSQEKPGNRNIKYLKKPGWIKRILFAILYHIGTLLFGLPKVGRYTFKRQWNLLWNLKLSKKADAILAVDLKSLWIAQRIHENVHLVSLEIYENDPLMKSIDKEQIKSVIIQSEQRFRFLFPHDDIPVFYVQNAPPFKDVKNPNSRNGLVYNGTAIPEFGIFQCVEYVNKHRDQTLTIKGAVPDIIQTELEMKFKTLFDSNNLLIDKSYTDLSGLSEYLSNYKVGFCFYDLSFKRINTFNYITAPSGKMFAYLAAGVPVIGNDIPGLSIIKDWNCGVLIQEITSLEISKAVNTIIKDFSTYTFNAITAAKFFDFNQRIRPFITHLENSMERNA